MRGVRKYYPPGEQSSWGGGPLSEAEWWRGQHIRAELKYRIRDRRGISEDVASGDPDHLKPFGSKPSVAGHVLDLRLVPVMYCPIDFNNELRDRTIEIGDERADSILSAEADAGG